MAILGSDELRARVVLGDVYDRTRKAGPTDRDIVDGIKNDPNLLKPVLKKRVERLDQTSGILPQVEQVLVYAVPYFIGRLQLYAFLITRLYPSLKGRFSNNRVRTIKHVLLILVVCKVFYDFISLLYKTPTFEGRKQVLISYLKKYVQFFGSGLVMTLLPQLNFLNPLSKGSGIAWHPITAAQTYFSSVRDNPYAYLTSWTVSILPNPPPSIEIEPDGDLSLPVDQAVHHIMIRLIPVLIFKSMMTSHAMTLFRRPAN
ncbi:hypothetical protein K0U07_02640 [bacterium]|nr:hypothetical protein [bacterium]